MLVITLMATFLMNILLLMSCTTLNIDESYDGFRVLAFCNGLAVAWFAWLVLKVGVTIEVIVK